MENMSFKEFRAWCNDRACDGCWKMLTAMACIDLLEKIQRVPFWKREKTWQHEYKDQVLKEIINPIEAKIKELKAKI